MPSEQRTWFIRLPSETIGPLPTETVLGLIKNRRVDFADFGWYEGLKEWTRLFSIQELKELLPAYPRVPLPLTVSAVRTSRARAARAPLRGKMIASKTGTLDIVNLSETGMLIKASQIPPLGTEVEFTIESASLPQLAGSLILGRVARREESPVFKGFGIEFVQLEEDKRAVLRAFIEASVKV